MIQFALYCLTSSDTILTLLSECGSTGQLRVLQGGQASRFLQGRPKSGQTLGIVIHDPIISWGMDFHDRLHQKTLIIFTCQVLPSEGTGPGPRRSSLLSPCMSIVQPLQRRLHCFPVPPLSLSPSTQLDLAACC